MRKDPDKDIIYVNKILGKQASIAFIPAEQIIPWLVLIVISYVITNGIFSFGIPCFLIISFWLIVSWWLLTGNQPHKFLDKFRKPPGDEWCNGNLLFLSPLLEKRPVFISKKYPRKNVQIKLKPIIKPTQTGKKKRFMPFQNYQNLICLVNIHTRGRTVSAYLLHQGNQYQVVFGFVSKGFHNILSREEISNTSTALQEGLKDILPGEKITFHFGCYSQDKNRQKTLTELADNCQLTPISVLIRNEQKRVQQLTRDGSRQNWQQIIFCTWTFNENTGSVSQDFLSKIINSGHQSLNYFLEWFTGNRRIYQEQFYQQLLIKAFEEGYLRWELLLNTKIGLEVKPCSANKLWQWLWHKFNDAPIPPIPQLMQLQENSSGYQLKLDKTTEKHACTVLIEGNNGISSCPEHNKTDDTILLPNKKLKCAVLTMEEAPSAWINTREQLRWLWTIMSKSYVHDTEAIVEISSTSNTLIKDNLAKQAKQAKTAKERAFTQGQGRDVGAEVKADESFEAQKKLYQGAKAIHGAITFFIYRTTNQELERDCMMFSHSFGTAKVLRERNIAWAIWLESLPITSTWLLHNSSVISERRLTLDTETTPGILPLTLPHSLDQKGVEFITEGGKPVYVDLIHNQTSRGLITGESGSGKSVVGWRFILDALAANIPVVGMDISSGSGSTFATAIKLLGDKGAYYDITSCSSNLLEPPDLRNFNFAERIPRLEQWQEFIRKALTSIVLGKIKDSKLAQRVDSIILLMLKNFLHDADIIERYNLAFFHGWKSAQWQKMPTLKDLLKFCSKEQLNLPYFGELDKVAINQIISQCNTLINSSLGNALCKPSSFSPDPAIKFFAFSGLNNENDQYLMAINAHAACIRNALSHPKSLFVGDELSVLFKKDGFADAVGELCAVGRKNGIGVLLLAQDLDSICDCSAGAQIMQNMVYRITGRLTTNGANSWIQRLGYSPSIINQNTTDKFLPRASQLYSNWLIERSGKFWQCRYYPGEMVLATVANNQSEQKARERIMAQYSSDLKGQLLALKEFTGYYVKAIKEGLSLDK